MRKVLVTGAEGFIGKNLCLRLRELEGVEVKPIGRSADKVTWQSGVEQSDVVVHLAGINRPRDPADFSGNPSSIRGVITAMDCAGRPLPIILASSQRAGDSSPYGTSKKEAEDALLDYAARTGAAVAIYRLPNVFGKWARPNYNSAVATFCHNVARELPITIHDPTASLDLVYVDDVVDTFLAQIEQSFGTGFFEVSPVYHTTVGEVAGAIRGFRADRADNMIANVGTGLLRALYATYVSYLPVEEFSYEIASHRDPRGAFSEMLKTREAGQFSYFTALPGVTRGGHYHHTKTEKFLIVQGEAQFRFRHVLTGETREVCTSGESPVVVETVPGWTHDVTNIGEGIMVSALWANELFDRQRPDTIAMKV